MSIKKVIKLLLLSFLINILCIPLLFQQKENYEYALGVKSDQLVDVRNKLNHVTKKLEASKRALSLLGNEHSKREVVFTNYYKGDSEGSTAKTGSGITTDKFQINEKGWYLYEGKVVIAAATYECL